jgi:hypothetical protein
MRIAYADPPYVGQARKHSTGCSCLGNDACGGLVCGARRLDVALDEYYAARHSKDGARLATAIEGVKNACRGRA